MRLKSITISGFKSFADSTTFLFPGNLCAIVGPNGCGKSNVIDAVRWVLGESSAKQLRGDTLADVVFNGSRSRKPAARASVDLLFDNSSGRLGGEFASYGEISVRRQLTRNMQSIYFLNGQRCRRRDIFDLFSGTGAGNSGYAIVEQGTISRLVEANPVVLRACIEDAAGISLYKTRRRETEDRILHVRGNLERLSDLRGELERQLRKLQAQAREARRYTKLVEKRDLSKGRLLALRHRELTRDHERLGAEQFRLAAQAEITAAALTQVENRILEHRTRKDDLCAREQKLRASCFALGSEIAKHEEMLQVHLKNIKRYQKEIAETQDRQAKMVDDLQGDDIQITELATRLEELQPDLERARLAAVALQQALQDIEADCTRHQEHWDGFVETTSTAGRLVQGHSAELKDAGLRLQQLHERLDKMVAEQDEIRANCLATEIVRARGLVQEQEQHLSRGRKSLEALGDEGRDLDARIKGLHALLHEFRQKLETNRGRLAALKALQQNALTSSDGAVTSWLQAQGLANCPRLGERIQIDPGWEHALEMVLSDLLQALLVVDQVSLEECLEGMEEGDLCFLTDDPGRREVAASVGLPRLFDMVRGPIPAILASIRAAETLSEALAVRRDLGAGESVVTKGCIWLGRDWVRIRRGRKLSSGVLMRERQIAELEEEISQCLARVHDHEREVDGLEQERATLMRRSTEAQSRLDSFQDKSAQAQASLKSLQAKQEAMLLRRQYIDMEIKELQKFIGEESRRQEESRERMQQEQRREQELVAGRRGLLAERDRLADARVQAQSRMAAQQADLYALETRIQKLAVERESALGARDRLLLLRADLGRREKALDRDIRESDAAMTATQAELTAGLAARIELEQDLAVLREEIEGVDANLRDLGRERQQSDTVAREQRELLGNVRLRLQDVESQRKALEERFLEGDHDLEALLGDLPEDVNAGNLEEEIRTLSRRLEQIGPVNLTAIAEHREQAQRQQELDDHTQDLESALGNLERAIKDIDTVTRSRFGASITRINESLQGYFGKIFGGGQASLRVTGEDLLNAEITVQARPPGKRNTSIQMLSGGEKALTAISLMFAMIDLNPAPFCMLDEVDAPLDDSNVIRYTQLLSEIGRRMQFVFVTHNKLSMEMADYLIGIVMRDPGVSSLVSVDVAAAQAAVL